MTEGRPAAKRTTKATATSTKGRPVEDVHLPPDPEAGINELQMRRLHGLFRSRLRLTDRADILEYLATRLGRPIRSRTELTRDEADNLIADLDRLPPAPAGGATITEVLSSVMNHVRAVGKDSQAPPILGGFHFRGVDAVVNAVAPALRDAGVVVMPEVLSVERVTTQSRQGATMLNVYVTTRYTFHGPAGDSLSTVVLGEAADAGDKATSKAQSVALRVALLQALMLPTDEPDPDTQGYERDQPPAEPPVAENSRAWPPKGESLLRLDDLAAQIGKTRADVTAKWRAAHGDLPVERLVDLTPDVLAGLADAVAARVEEMVRTQA